MKTTLYQNIIPPSINKLKTIPLRNFRRQPIYTRFKKTSYYNTLTLHYIHIALRSLLLCTHVG